MTLKRILVAGGAGFIGAHLCRKLLSENHHVICLDNLSSSNRQTIEDLFSNPRFEFIEHDINNPIQIIANDIFNLACPASPIDYQKDPIQTIKTNVNGSINLLELAKENHARILQASTSEVYGDPRIHPQPESYWGNVNPIGIRSCYNEGKRCAESIFFDYHRKENIHIKIVRIFNTYGPGMRPNDGRVISNFIIQALNNAPITIFGNGQQTRSFCFVTDLIDGLIKMMHTDATLTGPINLGNPTEISIYELARKIIAMTHSKSEIIHQSLPQDDPYRRKPSIEIANTLLNWSPVTNLTNGLEETIAHFKKNYL